MSPLMVVTVAFGLYILVVLTVGLLASRQSSKSPDEYFLAGRTLGPFVLFMALFGTNCTPFVLIGIPGKAYHHGIGLFGLNAPIIALGIPLTFWAIGAPARRMGQRLGALTPAELFAKRFQSRGLGLLLFGAFTLYTLPYMVSGVIGASLTLTSASQGAIPSWAGGLLVLAVALIYTALGGMRATAWTNVIQGLIFMAFMVAAFFFMSGSMGGLEAATAAVAEKVPQHLTLPSDGLFTPQAWTSWGLAISLCVISFPHMFVRLMSAKDDRAIQSSCKLYPPALIALWLPAVFIGVWGAAKFAGLEGKESDKIFWLMANGHLPPWLASMAFLAVLAAVMSTLDAQILTLSSMLVRDAMDPYLAADRQRNDVLAGRLFGVGIAVLVYILSMTMSQSVFDIAKIAFFGYVTLVPTLFFGVRWQRFTLKGAVASVLSANAVLWLGMAGWLPMFGFLPVFWALVVGIITALAVSWADSPPNAQDMERVFGAAPMAAE